MSEWSSGVCSTGWEPGNHIHGRIRLPACQGGSEHCRKFLHRCLSLSVMCTGWKEELSPKHPQNRGGMTHILVCDGWRSTALQGSELSLWWEISASHREGGRVEIESTTPCSGASDRKHNGYNNPHLPWLSTKFTLFPPSYSKISQILGSFFSWLKKTLNGDVCY